MTSPWIAYNDLAWVEDWLAGPEDYELEAAVYVKLIQQAATSSLGRAPRTLLHLGCGAGGHDREFKRHFTITGVDLSPGMLNMARARHPEIEYLEDDMRSVRLERLFDAVIIPDCIDYMTTPEELRMAVRTAVEHLHPGGVLLVVGKPAETFQDNNFAYRGEKDGVHVTLLENNYVNPYRPGTYEATFFYLIRRHGDLTTHTDHHVLGLFPQTTWDQVYQEAGLTMRQEVLDGIYDKFLLNDGVYPMTIYVGQKS
ncbi:class I SAM-dependent methyltransferase [Desulfonatronum thioautotrophicum]|uniref:class I SAM-dependent methyltransferase n=1 Tax=Desulfonatronum thioautotrophicum TaxID=617001 RepID=UPI0005EB4F7A|nr:class I SAM-dependent methyltransferase [Desulfonatronum thioautotrophicum]